MVWLIQPCFIPHFLFYHTIMLSWNCGSGILYVATVTGISLDRFSLGNHTVRIYRVFTIVLLTLPFIEVHGDISLSTLSYHGRRHIRSPYQSLC